jgi:hypothetical protein
MTTESLASYLRQCIPDGLPYGDAAELCLHLYCVASDLPTELRPQTERQCLADTFAHLAGSGWITDQESELRCLYGAHFHSVHDRGHWVEVIASIYKKGTQDIARGSELARALRRDGNPS